MTDLFLGQALTPRETLEDLIAKNRDNFGYGTILGWLSVIGAPQVEIMRE